MVFARCAHEAPRRVAKHAPARPGPHTVPANGQADLAAMRVDPPARKSGGRS